MPLHPKLEKSLAVYGQVDPVLECVWKEKPAAVAFSADRLVLVATGMGNEQAAPYRITKVNSAAGLEREIQFYGMRCTVRFHNSADAVAFDSALAVRHAAEPAAKVQPPLPPPLLVVTMNDIPGYRIDTVHGDVFGLTVRARNYFSNIGANFRTVVGGEAAGYTRLLAESRIEARERMMAEARRMGANAIVAMRFDCNEIGDIMSEVAAYGTAVSVTRITAEGSGSGLGSTAST